ncbi:MAG: hypothetical protein J0L73_28590 [Verrucomicrobia bacterium]|nr:hypothetical protein [Verrucomicrobiota bacterium]
MSSTPLAPNRQAEMSIEVQHIEVPSDLPLAAIQSPAIAALCRVEGGSLITEFNDTLREVVGAAYNLNKAGEITLKLKFKPGGKNRMTILPSISAKIPKEERAETSMFVAQGGQLTPYDPEQERLPLKVMKFHETAATIIDVPAEKPAARVV